MSYKPSIRQTARVGLAMKTVGANNVLIIQLPDTVPEEMMQKCAEQIREELTEGDSKIPVLLTRQGCKAQVADEALMKELGWVRLQ